MSRNLCLVHALIRRQAGDQVCFYMQEHPRWRQENGLPFLSLPTKKTVTQPGSAYLNGESLEKFIDDIMQQDLGLAAEQYLLDQELEPVSVEMISPTRQVRTHYYIYSTDVWVPPDWRDRLEQMTGGYWLSPHAALEEPRTSPTARAVFENVLKREQELAVRYQDNPDEEWKPEAPRRLLTEVADQPGMDALAKKWHADNRSGVRCLRWPEIEAILGAGNRAFNLLVADPYLRYHNQGYGVTWSFFTHKDRQDLHVHGAPTVEIYGVLSGRLEIWWKPYHDRGACAWSHRIVGPLDWIEVGPMQCHIVHWLEEGIGVVFKGGPGPLAGVGRIGVAGKTVCDGCPCQKPPDLIQLEMRCR